MEDRWLVRPIRLLARLIKWESDSVQVYLAVRKENVKMEGEAGQPYTLHPKP